MSASSTASGAHSASGNLSTAASYRPGPYAAAVGVALVDGTAAVDRGNASVSTQDGSEIKVMAHTVISNSNGRNAVMQGEAKQSLLEQQQLCETEHMHCVVKMTDAFCSCTEWAHALKAVYLSLHATTFVTVMMQV